LPQEPYPMRHPEVEQRLNITGETVANGHRAFQLHLAPQVGTKIVEDGAKEGQMWLTDWSSDADGLAGDAKCREPPQSGELPAYAGLRVIHKRLAGLIERQEPITVGRKVDGNAHRLEMLHENYRIGKDRGVLGDRLPIVVCYRLDNRGSDREAARVQGTGHQGVL